MDLTSPCIHAFIHKNFFLINIKGLRYVLVNIRGVDLIKRDTKEYNFKSLKLDLSFVGDFVFGIAFVPKGTIFFKLANETMYLMMFTITLTSSSVNKKFMSIFA
jgi:hypothetical protein